MIHAVHSFYMNEMGGLRGALPLTWLFMLVAALSLMGVPPFPGFWSKDAVLLVANARPFALDEQQPAEHIAGIALDFLMPGRSVQVSKLALAGLHYCDHDAAAFQQERLLDYP